MSAATLAGTDLAAAIGRDNAKRAADDLAVTVRNMGGAELLDIAGVPR